MRANPQFSVDLVTFTEEILKGKLHFLYSVFYISRVCISVYLCEAFKTLFSCKDEDIGRFLYLH